MFVSREVVVHFEERDEKRVKWSRERVNVLCSRNVLGRKERRRMKLLSEWELVRCFLLRWRGQRGFVRLHMGGGMGGGPVVRNLWTVAENWFSANFEERAVRKVGDEDARFRNEERN